MEKEFVPYELAVKLKELGFDEPCFGYYLAGGVRIKEYKESQNKNSAFFNNTVCSLPLYQQAFRWFREKYEIYYTIEGSKKFGFQYFIYDEKESYEIKSEETFKRYEEAELACLDKLIEIVEKNSCENY